MKSLRGEWWKSADVNINSVTITGNSLDPELGLAQPTATPSDYLRMSYYERLCRDEFVLKLKSGTRELKTHIFTHLRHLAICGVNDKLLFLENKLTRHGRLSEDELEDMGLLLHRQADLVRDFEYMTRLDMPGFYHHVDEDTEISARSRFPEHDGLSHLEGKLKSVLRVRPTQAKSLVRYLSRALPPWFASSAAEWAKRRHYTSTRPPIVPSMAVRALAGAITTTAGGSFIILPMVIMSYGPSLTKSLATVALSVLAFGFTVDVFIAKASSETFLSTATYAAVLIVFVASSGVAS